MTKDMPKLFVFLAAVQFQRVEEYDFIHGKFIILYKNHNIYIQSKKNILTENYTIAIYI